MFSVVALPWSQLFAALTLVICPACDRAGAVDAEIVNTSGPPVVGVRDYAELSAVHPWSQERGLRRGERRQTALHRTPMKRAVHWDTSSQL